MEKYYGFTIFWKKCKQTAEISWLFIWDVKISKKLEKQSFGIFYSDVRTYLSLSSRTTQWPKLLCQYPCFVINPIYIRPGSPRQILFILVEWHPILNFLIKNPYWMKRHLGKVWKNIKTSRKSANFYYNTDQKV